MGFGPAGSVLGAVASRTDRTAEMGAWGRYDGRRLLRCAFPLAIILIRRSVERPSTAPRDRDGSPQGRDSALPRLGTKYDSPARRDRPDDWDEAEVCARRRGTAVGRRGVVVDDPISAAAPKLCYVEAGRL